MGDHRLNVEISVVGRNDKEEKISMWLNWWETSPQRVFNEMVEMANRAGLPVDSYCEQERVEHQCEAGCVHFTCGSIRHIKECANYPESLSELIDEQRIEIDHLKESVEDKISEALSNHIQEMDTLE